MFYPFVKNKEASMTQTGIFPKKKKDFRPVNIRQERGYGRKEGDGGLKGSWRTIPKVPRDVLKKEIQLFFM